MADETKTQIPKPTRQRGPMGRMGGMRRGEKAKDFKGTMRQLLGYIGQHKIAVFAAVAFAVCSVIFNIVGPKVLGQVTTKLFEGLVAKVNGTGDVDFDWIAKTLGFLLCLYLASSVCSLIQGWLMTGVTQKICYRMRKEIAAKIAVVPMSYFNGHSKGDVLSRITNDVDTLGQSLNQSVTQLITSVTQIIGVLVMMLSISLPLTGVTVLTLPAAAIILTVMIHFSQPYFREQQQVLGAVNGIIEEDFAGQNVIQVFDRAEASIEEFDRQNDRLFISGWRSQFLSGLMMPLMSLVGNMGYVGVVVVGAQLALTGNATPGDIQSFIQYVRNFTQPVQQLGNVSNTMQSMAAATERVFEFLAAPEEEQKADAQIPEKRPGHVEFDHVKFGYTPDKTIIHDFSCEAQPGQTIAIVGPTGAGKTTMVNLLMRFYEISGGTISIDGIDTKSVPRWNVHDQFSMVLQDTWVFRGTVRENIAYGAKDPEEKYIRLAAKLAQADHFIELLPDGYDTIIKEDGTNLSQGQRQLLTIARAMLSNPSIIVLDEATAMLDPIGRREVLAAVEKLNREQGITVVLITHDNSIAVQAERIIRLEDGRVVYDGDAHAPEAVVQPNFMMAEPKAGEEGTQA